MSTTNDILLVLAIIGVASVGYDKIRQIMYLRDDNNFKEDSKWPKWLIRDAKKWNKDNPNQQVKIREAK